MTKTSREFLLSLRPNDLLRVNGKLRVLRSVTHAQCGKHPPKASFAFSIMRCSWTRRPYTIKGIVEMMDARVELVARNYASKHPLSVEVDADIKDHMRRGLSCCDVIGIIY